MQLHCGAFVLLLIAFCNGPAIGLTTTKMEDGDFLKIVSVSSGNALTAGGSDATEGRPITVAPWSGQSSQKWMAVEALVSGNSFLLMPQRQRYPWARFIRNGGTDPYRNRHDDLPDWTMVIEANTNSGQVTQDARDGKLYQQWRAEKVESPSGGKRFLLKNRQNNQCLQAPGSPSTSSATQSPVTPTTTTTTPAPTTTRRSFFGNIWNSMRSVFGGGSSNSDSSSSSARSSRSNSQQSGGSTSGSSSATGNVFLAPCDSTDVRQHWQLEKLALEYS